MPYKADKNKLTLLIKDKQGLKVPCPAESKDQEQGVFLYLEKVPAFKGDTECTKTLLHLVKYFIEDGEKYGAWRSIPSKTGKGRWRMWDDLKVDSTILTDLADKIYEIAGVDPKSKAKDWKVEERDKMLRLMGER